MTFRQLFSLFFLTHIPDVLITQRLSRWNSAATWSE